jgi:hypothetical protein
MSHDPDEPFHEGMVLDAVLKRIESRDNVQRADVFDPEGTKEKVPIDLACRFGGQNIAFEHTGIEAFPGQIRLGKEAARLFDPIAERFKAFAAADECIQLLVPVDATSALKTKDIASVQDALRVWIEQTAPTLPVSRYPRHLLPIVKVEPQGIPFKVSLHRFNDCGAMGGRFWYVRSTGPVEEGRHQRLTQTRDKKFGKLAEWKKQTGARTILILEDADISLTNEQLVADTFARVEEGHVDLPDEVYVVTTFTKTWYVTCLRRPGHTYYDDGERYWPIDPSTLTDLTGR